MEQRKYKVARKLSGSPKVFRKWAEWDEGDWAIGKIHSRYIDNYDKECVVLDVEECGFKNRTAEKYIKGKHLGMNHNGMLAAALEGVADGTAIQVTYNGTSKIEKGKFAGKDAHVVEVSLLEEEVESDVSDSSDLL